MLRVKTHLVLIPVGCSAQRVLHTVQVAPTTSNVHPSGARHHVHASSDSCTRRGHPGQVPCGPIGVCIVVQVFLGLFEHPSAINLPALLSAWSISIHLERLLLQFTMLVHVHCTIPLLRNFLAHRTIELACTSMPRP